METKNIICPRCGGIIVLSEEQTHGVCEYCDSEYLLTEEELVSAENKAGIERNISGVHLREISRSRLDDYMFQRMDDETSKKYIEYRRRDCLQKRILYLLNIPASIVGIWAGYLMILQGIGWILILICFFDLIWCILIGAPRMFRMKKELKKATGYCEYTFAVLDCKKEIRFLCSDGRKLLYQIPDINEDTCENYEVVLVHVPSTGKIYVEPPEMIRKKLLLNE